MSRSQLRKIGTTVGLSQSCASPDRPEQVYVWIDEDDPTRPVVIEGWVGYAVPMKMRVTPAQARELLPLLAEALTAPEVTTSRKRKES